MAKVALSSLVCALSVACFLVSPAFAEMVTIGNPGNVADDAIRGNGSVPYVYQIGRTEVTNSEYAAFLNAVAATDSHGLYETRMANLYGGITRSGESGSYSYDVIPGRENNPVVYVSFLDAFRYANWLHNGMPVGIQAVVSTEGGAYTMTADGIANNTITRNPGALYFLPSDDEWYKAAYYNPATESYFEYATGTADQPTSEPPPGGLDAATSANYNNTVANTTPVGAYPGSLSPYGTADQNGNVAEWNEAAYAEFRQLRGGGWGSSHTALRSVFSDSADAEYETSHIGFRIASTAAVPEPTSLALLLTGFAALFAHGLVRSKHDA